MSRILEVVTPEQVSIRYELAGFGSRALAAGVDYLLQLILFALLGIIAALSGVLSVPDGPTQGPFWDKMGNSIVLGVFILVMFLITWGYFILFETLWNGMTPGKRLLGLRVIRDGGFPVDFRSVTIRNLLRAVDMLPGLPALPTYAFGFVSVLCNRQYRRLGDIAAGTVVVKHGTEEELPSGFTFGDTVVYRLLDATIFSQLSRMTREEYRLIKQFLDRRRDLPQSLRGEFAYRLALPLIEKFAYHVPPMGIDYERWLDELDLAYRTRALGQSIPTTQQETPAPISTPQEPPQQSATRRW